MVQKKPSRHRYVVFEIEPISSISERTLADYLSAAIGRQTTRLIFFDGVRGMLQCNHTARDDVIAFINGNHRIGRREVLIRTIGTSGTIRRARMKFID